MSGDRTVRQLLALRPGVACVRAGARVLYLTGGLAAQPIGRPTPALRRLLHRLAGPPCPPEELPGCQAPEVADPGDLDGDPTGVGGVGGVLAQLLTGGWLTVTVARGRDRLYTLAPDRPPPGPPPAHAPATAILSRFTLIRRDGDELVVESPLSWCRIHLHDPRLLAAVVAGLATPPDAVPPATPDPATPGPGADQVAQRLRRDLWWAGMIEPASEPADAELRLRQWEPHELWFHDRSRIGRRRLGAEFGGTWWARGRFDPVPARATRFPGTVVDLHRPDLDALRQTDPPLTAVLEDRRSVRTHDDSRALTADQLGEFLYRCARNRSVRSSGGVEYLSRPYPSGGSFYELELYPVVRHVTGLASGMYHYDPQEHRLERVTGPGAAVRRLLLAATWSTGPTTDPQVLIVITARFGRVMWKYEQMGYSVILKNVGVLYQTMYLVATAMGLAPCGQGGGEPAAFAAASGLDPLVESSVGEFLLGSCPPPGQGSGAG